MKPIIALLPNDDITQKIFQVRTDLIKKGWGIEGERLQVLPHLSVSYLTELSDNTLIEKIKEDLGSQFTKLNSITLNVVRVRTWSNKVSFMFDNRPVRELASKLESLISKYKVSDSKNYLSQLNKSEKILGEQTYSTFNEVAGDHIKIARNIKSEHLDEAVAYVSEFLPKKFVFNKFVFIDYGCTENDILWKLDLTM